ncbi:MAG: BamA/TamA family outer membrane protein [Bryobacteraceae bacterium]
MNLDAVMVNPCMKVSRFLLAFLLTVSGLAAQVNSRVQEIEEARDAKAATLEPDEPGKWERRLIYVKDAKLLERISAGVAGFRVQIGGMPTGSGFAVGPNYMRQDLARGKLTVNAFALVSTREWVKLGGGASIPRFYGDRLFWEGSAVYHNYNSLGYYGPGPDSQKTMRTNYAFEDTNLDTMLGVRVTPWLRAGGSIGFQHPNTGQGKNELYASTERVFGGNPRVIGLREEVDYLRGGFFVELDRRDNPGGPRAGSYVTMRWDYYDDRELKRHDFRRMDLEAQQYLPLFNKRRVIALRARTVQTFTTEGQTLPFYQQSVIGGANDLRGFRPYRFYDNNSLVMNAEYRWEVFSGLDMALFADAGQVTHDRWQFKPKDLETAVGFGFRFNARNIPFLRLDVGFSHEGFQVFLKFNGPFAGRSLFSSSAPHIF